VMMTVSMAGAAATIESAATPTTAIRASTSIATAIATASAIPATAAEGPLEARTRAAADAGRITLREVFARSAARGAGLAREEDLVFPRAGCRDLSRLGFEFLIVMFVMLF